MPGGSKASKAPSSRCPTQNWFALGVLFNFMKVFKYCSASKQLGNLTATIVKAAVMLLPILVVLILFMLGFGFAFHMSLGAHLEEYSTMETTLYTMLLVIFGKFDLREIDQLSMYKGFPLGLVLFLCYCCLTIFFLLMMLLKILDTSFKIVLSDEQGDSIAKDLQDAITYNISRVYLYFKEIMLMREVDRMVKKGNVNVEEVLKGANLGIKLNAQMRKDGESEQSSPGEEEKGGGPRTSLVDRELMKLVRKRRGRLTVEDLQKSRKVIVKQLVRQVGQ